MNFNLRTDLADEEFANDSSIDNQIKEYFGCKVSYLKLTDEQGKQFNKNGGIYYTLETSAFKDLDHDQEQNTIKALQKILMELLEELGITYEDEIFVVGLGNIDITPDALGPKVVSKLLITKHLHQNNLLDKDKRIVSALAPGVMGQTGIETSDIVNAIVKKEKPSLVVVIDALASRSLKRINQSIQITTAGINPGSGVGNKRKELSKRTLDTNVIAIGVPTVVDILSISDDVVDHLRNVVDDSFKEKLDAVRPNLITSIENDETLDFFVTPKEIDQNINDLADCLSRAINISFHNL